MYTRGIYLLSSFKVNTHLKIIIFLQEKKNSLLIFYYYLKKHFFITEKRTFRSYLLLKLLENFSRNI